VVASNQQDTSREDETSETNIRTSGWQERVSIGIGQTLASGRKR
jgi:hypothetical protein